MRESLPGIAVVHSTSRKVGRRLTRLAGVVAVVFAASVASPAAPATAISGWVQMSPLPRPTYGAGVAATGDHIFVFGGEDVPEANQVLSTSTGQWALRKKLLIPRVSLGAAALPDGRILAIGGYDTSRNSVTGAVHAYSPASNTWDRSQARLRVPREHLAVVIAAGQVHAIGGSTDSISRVAAHEVFDPTTNTWTSATPIPIATSAPAAVSHPDGSIYVLGGINGAGNDEVWRYDLGSENWTPEVPIPLGISSPAAAVGGDGLIYVYGGGFRSTQVRAYDPASNTWSKQPALVEPRDDIAAASDSDGSIYAIGGCGEYRGSPLTCASNTVERSVTVQCSITGTPAADSLEGTAGDDVLCGLAGNDTFVPGAGNDVLVGGNGFDTGDFGSAPAPIDGDLRAASVTGWGEDELLSVEGLVGSSYADHLDGDSYKNRLDGRGGADSVAGREGDDEIYGGDGPDKLYPGLGSDTVAGGAGTDLIDYFVAPSAGLTISLAGEYAFGDLFGDRVDTLFKSIENVNGTRFADTIYGTDGGNVLSGLDGDDRIFAYGGDDTLSGGIGDDELDGGEGTDGCLQGPGVGFLTSCES